jgi:hypothetical protein
MESSHPRTVIEVPTSLRSNAIQEAPIGFSPPNQYEMLILPCNNSITNEPLLRCTPYIINIQYLVLICTQCKHAVNPGSAFKHVRKLHPGCKVPATLAAQLNEKYPMLTAEKIQPQEMVEPIFGLSVPGEEYTICARCRHGYGTMVSFRNHACERSDTDLNGRLPYFASLVQTFFRGRQLCYFPIKTPRPGVDRTTTDDFALFQSQRTDDNSAEDEVEAPENYRELNQFLSKEGWVSHVIGFSKSELSSLTSAPGKDDHLAPVANEVIALMSNMQLIIGRAGFHVRRLLGWRPS